MATTVRGADIGIGLPLGLAAFYGLSVASALWVGRVTFADYVWSLIIGAVVCCLLGLMVAARAASAVVASGTMLVLAAIGIATGSEMYLWIPPFPADLLPLLFHGSRSPVVFGPLVLVGTASTIRIISSARRAREVRVAAGE